MKYHPLLGLTCCFFCDKSCWRSLYLYDSDEVNSRKVHVCPSSEHRDICQRTLISIPADGMPSYFCCAGTSLKTLCPAYSSIRHPLRFHLPCMQNPREYNAINDVGWWLVHTSESLCEVLAHRFSFLSSIGWCFCTRRQPRRTSNYFGSTWFARTNKIHWYHHRMQTCTHCGVPMFNAGPPGLILSQGPWMVFVQQKGQQLSWLPDCLQWCAHNKTMHYSVDLQGDDDNAVEDANIIIDDETETISVPPTWCMRCNTKEMQYT